MSGQLEIGEGAALTDRYAARDLASFHQAAAAYLSEHHGVPVYAIYLLATREWRHILPDRHAAREACASPARTGCGLQRAELRPHPERVRRRQ